MSYCDLRPGAVNYWHPLGYDLAWFDHHLVFDTDWGSGALLVRLPVVLPIRGSANPWANNFARNAKLWFGARARG